MEWIVFTADQYSDVLIRNNETEFQVRPRLVDLDTHEQFGNYVSPADVTTGEYEEFWSEYLASHLRIVATPDELFVPSDV